MEAQSTMQRRLSLTEAPSADRRDLTFPDRSPKFGIVDRPPFTELKVPIWNRQNHIFPFTITLTIALIFFRIESFPVIKEFNLCRSSEAFVLEVSKANRQLQPAYAVNLYDVDEAGRSHTTVL